MNAHLGYESNNHDYKSTENRRNGYSGKTIKTSYGEFYAFLFVDCMYVSIKKEYETKEYAVYTILGYDANGMKDILGIWLNETESKHNWMQINEFTEQDIWEQTRKVINNA